MPPDSQPAPSGRPQAAPKRHNTSSDAPPRGDFYPHFLMTTHGAIILAAARNSKDPSVHQFLLSYALHHRRNTDESVGPTDLLVSLNKKVKQALRLDKKNRAFSRFLKGINPQNPLATLAAWEVFLQDAPSLKALLVDERVAESLRALNWDYVCYKNRKTPTTDSLGRSMSLVPPPPPRRSPFQAKPAVALSTGSHLSGSGAAAAASGSAAADGRPPRDLPRGIIESLSARARQRARHAKRARPGTGPGTAASALKRSRTLGPAASAAMLASPLTRSLSGQLFDDCLPSFRQCIVKLLKKHGVCNLLHRKPATEEVSVLLDRMEESGLIYYEECFSSTARGAIQRLLSAKWFIPFEDEGACRAFHEELATLFSDVMDIAPETLSRGAKYISLFTMENFQPTLAGSVATALSKIEASSPEREMRLAVRQ